LKGVSRSASFVIAYLMRENHMSYFDALCHVREFRGHAGPNLVFAQQLQEYERKIKSKEEVKVS
jgi:protein-tyrosine phosphatase